MLRLQNKIKSIEAELDSNKILLIDYNNQLKNKLFTPPCMVPVLLLFFSAGCYLEIKQRKNNYSLFYTLKNTGLTTLVFCSKFIKLLGNK
jgi:hypothetical protein